MTLSTVAITGMGAVSALGPGVMAQLEGLRNGRSGITRSTVLGLPFPELHFGEVPLTQEQLARSSGVAADRSRTVLLGLLAAREAMEHVPLDRPERCALLSASTVGGMDRTAQVAAAWSKGHMQEAALAMGHPVGDHALHLARALGIGGHVSTLSTACSSSANAILLGASMLRAGMVDMVLAGGTDALSTFTVHGFRSLSAMDPEPCRPFSEDRNGMNLGEGAAYLVMEREVDARTSGRTPLALVLGAANANDAHHQTATSPDGAGPYRAMSLALEQAGLAKEQVDMINAHGTGTGNNDLTEQLAMERLFGIPPPFVSTKAVTGHTLAAAGALEAVFSVLSIQHGFVPANLRWSNPISGLNAAPCTEILRITIDHVLSTSFGFGGNDTALVLSKA
ncbi:MAG: beta-ketoacyl-[acyl-carrier-protein] synthase family protein [Flavobacteriales bacterium]|nr:beta-ketoacyl-[acyl-carrier-protein] synthase family protein [Flavobacteriales bacterium]